MAGRPLSKVLALWVFRLTRVRNQVVMLVLCGIVFVVWPTLQYHHDETRKFPWSILGHSQSSIEFPCDGFPSTDNIVVSMKTRAAKAHAKLPGHFLTHLRCIPDALVFSDMEQTISGHHVYDALDRVSELVKLVNKAFSFYDDQKECASTREQCKSNPSLSAELDKYMIMNMVSRAWEMRPNRDWYIFIEDDTYVIWPNLMHWLRKKANPNRDAFVGSVVMLDGLAFAHGGSGFILAGETVNQLMARTPNMAETFDKTVRKYEFGGIALAQALQHIDVPVKQAHPMFNGEKASSTPFGQTHWCQPVLTMASMSTEDLSAVWQYEKTRNTTEIIQYRHLYEAFIKPQMAYFRRGWDNQASDRCYVSFNDEGRVSDAIHKKLRLDSKKSVVEKYAHKSPASCAKVCEAEGLDISATEFTSLSTHTERGQFVRAKYEKKARRDAYFRLNRRCFQWRYEDGICCVSSHFKLGRPAEVRKKKEDDGDDEDDGEGAGEKEKKTEEEGKEEEQEEEEQDEEHEDEDEQDAHHNRKKRRIKRDDDDQEPADDPQPTLVTSGWFVKGITDWIESMGDCKVDWKEPALPS